MFNKENPSYHMNYLMLRKMTDIGVAVNILNEVLRHEIFDDLSKHGRMWQSDHESEFERLHEVRFALSTIEEKVSKAIEILDVEVTE